MSGSPDEQETLDKLDTELELIEASLLPVESLSSSARDSLPRTIDMSSTDSQLRISINVSQGYPGRDAVVMEIKGADIGRDEAEEWKTKVEGMMQEWDDESDTPLYTIMTTHFLPLLSIPRSLSSASPDDATPPKPTPMPHHALIVTHHLLSPTKRKLLIQLSSELNLVGFSKTGHPGILYATGDKEDIQEWLVQVKSWNWLALKVRIACEPVPEYKDDRTATAGAGTAMGGEQAKGEGGKSRGDWVELDKLSDSLEWMRNIGREQLLIDAGVGS